MWPCSGKYPVCTIALRDCILATWVWNSLLPGNIKGIFFTLNLREWLINNISSWRRSEKDDNWSLVFGVTIWKLWNWRNQSLIANGSPCSFQVVSDIKAWVHAIQQLNKTNLNSRNCKVSVGVGWTAPRWPYFQLKVFMVQEDLMEKLVHEV